MTKASRTVSRSSCPLHLLAPIILNEIGELQEDGQRLLYIKVTSMEIGELKYRLEILPVFGRSLPLSFEWLQTSPRTREKRPSSP